MQDFKNKLFNYQTPPPEETWENIIEELNNEKVIKIPSYRKNKFLFYGATAAASVIIIFLGSIFIKKNSNSIFSSKSPVEKENALIAKKIKDSLNLNQQILKSIINNPEEEKEIISNNSILDEEPTKYIIVAGPEGQPVKISPKVATLIISADNEYPPKPVWRDQIKKWQKIMLGITTSPTSANFVNLVQGAANKENIE
ncbi:MAG: hypothetical protein ABI261_00985 [Ginsengibacter sp.]